MIAYDVSICNREIGHIGKYVGNPPSERWVAHSIHGQLNRRFATLRSAERWLADVDRVLRPLMEARP